MEVKCKGKKEILKRKLKELGSNYYIHQKNWLHLKIVTFIDDKSNLEGRPNRSLKEAIETIEVAEGPNGLSLTIKIFRSDDPCTTSSN